MQFGGIIGYSSFKLKRLGSGEISTPNGIVLGHLSDFLPGKESSSILSTSECQEIARPLSGHDDTSCNIL